MSPTFLDNLQRGDGAAARSGAAHVVAVDDDLRAAFLAGAMALEAVTETFERLAADHLDADAAEHAQESRRHAEVLRAACTDEPRDRDPRSR